MRNSIFACLFLVWTGEIFGQSKLLLSNTSWTGTHSPLKKGNEIYFQGDTLIIVDLEGIKPADQYVFAQQNDTLFLHIIDELSFTCREERPGRYKISWANNGEKLLLKPIEDHCIERFTLLVSESPWFRIRSKKEIRSDWHFLDPEKDKVAGIGLYETNKLLRFRKSTPVTVAVIDCPVDYTHEDLQDVMWKNPKEISDNKEDDDANGFKDDVYGWFFMCSKTGIPISHEQGEGTRTYALWKSRFDTISNPNRLNTSEKIDFQNFQKAKKKFLKQYELAQACRLVSSDSILYFKVLSQIHSLAKDPVDENQIKSWNLGNDEFSQSMKLIVSNLYEKRFSNFNQFVRLRLSNFSEFKKRRSRTWLYDFNLEWNPRVQIGDHPEIVNEKMYGSGFLKDPGNQDNDHGTHVAGIIGAKKGNGKGIDGIAENVRIMTLGAVPGSGDERDKDVANSIRYAADHGAKIINMSFGKEFSPQKVAIDEALKYAEKKGILVVKAAGNGHDDIDTSDHFPVCKYEKGGKYKNWILVGNNTSSLDSQLVAPSSNYGKKTVDIFAPGTDIFSTTPGNTYDRMTGTSMASPVVAGVAALIWSYFPNLTAGELKQILIESAFKPELIVFRPGSKVKLPFKSLSSTGGIINAKSAFLLAEKASKKKKA